MALREAKKAATRTAIADAALGLFLERGFDRVTVAEVARVAGVSVNTAFNYFPTKEDLFFDREDQVVRRLAGAVASRAPGESAVTAVRNAFLRELDDDEPTLGLHPGAAAFHRVIENSTALQARLRRLHDDARDALATELAAATKATVDDPAPRMAAAVLAGLDAALHAEAHRRMMAGERPDDIRSALRAAAVHGFTLAAQGLGTYGA
ncbi:TetR/AcrR family transcriptional regulator [Catenuloplanes japonicus]|uniref:TetR/AcrR family transcriptional regulator n=1 Tax=Catenuloplanes japonicus TaxID=33876 RepID=UPI000525E964|nr:TetR/AcrR family transcriptional regulator [Catenuloplanes japonicus]